MNTLVITAKIESLEEERVLNYQHEEELLVRCRAAFRFNTGKNRSSRETLIAIARGSKAEFLRDNWQYAIFVLVGRIDLEAKNIGKGTTTYVTTLYVERATIQQDLRAVEPIDIHNVIALPLDEIQEIAI